MLALIKKDFRVHSKLLLISLVTYAILLWIMTDQQIPMMITLVFAFLSIRTIDGVEEANHSIRLIQSLPVKRSEVVWAKHLVNFSYIFITSLTVFILNGLLTQLQSNGLGDLILVWSMGLLLVTVYNLLYLLLGPRWMTVAFFVLFILFVSFGWSLMRMPFFVRIIQFFQNAGSLKAHLIVAGIALVLSAIFIFISQQIYQKKDL